MNNNLSEIFDSAHDRTYQKGQILLYQGEQTEKVFYITKGYVKVYDVTAQGTEKLIMLLGPGDLFPIVWTFGGKKDLHYFYETFTAAELSVIEKSDLLAANDKDHAVTKSLLEYFVDRSQELLARIECIEATSAKHKVAQVYDYLAAALGEKVAKEAYKLELPLTHQSIADMAGITRETASLQIKELIEENLIESSKSVLLIHRDRIENFLAA